jgi:hypothetical protein
VGLVASVLDADGRVGLVGLRALDAHLVVAGRDMPLIKSKSPKAVGANIKTEMSAGKPRKQAIAIALSTQRRAGKGKR